jgi:hypothetical protein
MNSIGYLLQGKYPIHEKISDEIPLETLALHFPLSSL